jgi:hypothetical protein
MNNGGKDYGQGSGGCSDIMSQGMVCKQSHGSLPDIKGGNLNSLANCTTAAPTDSFLGING